MNSRERIMKAINHKEPDKIPIDCAGMRSTGISGIAYNNLKKYLNIKNGETRMYDMIQQLAIPENWYYERFKIDAYNFSLSMAEDDCHWKNWKLPDGSQAQRPNWFDIEKDGDDWVCIDSEGDILAQMPDSSCFFNQVYWPLMKKNKMDLKDLDYYVNKVMWKYMTDPGGRGKDSSKYYSRIRKKVYKLFKNTDYLITALFGGQLFEMGQFLYRSDNFLINLVSNQKSMVKMLNELTELHLLNLKKFLNAVNPYVQVIVFSDDFGMQSGPMISPDLYRKIFLPLQKKLFGLVKEKSDIKVLLHSCGAIKEFLPDFIDAGVDIINPVQISASGMNLKKLKKEFGQDIVFWGGGIDTQHTLRAGSPNQVADEVKRNCEVLMKGGGFIFNQVHNILPEVPPKNIVSMYDTVNDIRY